MTPLTTSEEEHMGRGSWAGDDSGGHDHGLSRRKLLGNAAGTILASGASGVLLAGCGNGDGNGSNGIDKVTFLTIIPLNLGFISEVLGVVNGRFKQQGLDVTIQSTRGSAPAVQSFLQGS